MIVSKSAAECKEVTYPEGAPAVDGSGARECETRAIQRNDLYKILRDVSKCLTRYSSRRALPGIQIPLIVGGISPI